MSGGLSGGRGAGYRPALDGIRALAVILVVLFHLDARWVPGGFIGVDVFFVLSGYLITGLLLDEVGATGRLGLRRFYARRVRRLLPASIAVLAVVTFLSIHLFDAVQRQRFGHDTTAAALYSANWRFAVTGGDYFAPGDVPSPVIHYWSLAVEEQFYLVWPGLFLGLWWLVRRVVGRASTTALLVPIGLLVAASAIASIVLVPSPLAYYGTHTRAYQLLAGAALVVIAQRRPEPGRSRALGVLGLAGVAAIVWLAHGVRDAGGYPGWSGVAVTVASLAMIAGVDLTTWGPGRALLGRPAPALVGRLSYSLYIWHWPVIVFLPLLGARWGLDVLGGTPAAVGAMVLLALLSYLVVERPIRFHLRPTAPAGAVVAVGLVMSAVVGVVGIPWLQPRDAFAARALAAVDDGADPGSCPFAERDWPSPAESEPCVRRRGHGLTVALVGDSHAHQWQPAFDELAARYDLTFIRATRGGCPANDITVLAEDESGRTFVNERCTAWRHHVFTSLVQRFDPDVVFVATRSQARNIDFGRGVVLTNDDRHLPLWMAGWDRTLRMLGAGGAQVIVSHIVPTLPEAVPACLAAHGPSTHRCDFPADGDRVVNRFNAALDALDGRRVVAGGPPVRVVDPLPIICPDGVCPAMIGDIIVHRDTNHVSASFVRSRADEIGAMLRAAGADL